LFPKLGPLPQISHVDATAVLLLVQMVPMGTGRKGTLKAVMDANSMLARATHKAKLGELTLLRGRMLGWLH
jgi:hypothetical protein